MLITKTAIERFNPISKLTREQTNSNIDSH